MHTVIFLRNNENEYLGVRFKRVKDKNDSNSEFESNWFFFKTMALLKIHNLGTPELQLDIHLYTSNK